MHVDLNMGGGCKMSSVLTIYNFRHFQQTVNATAYTCIVIFCAQLENNYVHYTFVTFICRR